MNGFGHTQVSIIRGKWDAKLGQKCGHNHDSHILPTSFHPWKVLSIENCQNYKTVTTLKFKLLASPRNFLLL